MKIPYPKTALVRLACWIALVSLLVPPGALADSEVAAGTRFLVELQDKLEASKVKRGKKFEARTIEVLRASDGRWIPAGAKLKGQVTYVEDNKMMLRFERIETRRGKLPIVASVVQIQDEKDVKKSPGEEGEIQASGGRGKSATIGAIVGGGVGAAIGAKQGGGKGAAIGAGTGAAAGALIGAAAGGKDLVLHEGTRLELQLDRPLVVP